MTCKYEALQNYLNGQTKSRRPQGAAVGALSTAHRLAHTDSQRIELQTIASYHFYNHAEKRQGPSWAFAQRCQSHCCWAAHAEVRSSPRLPAVRCCHRQTPDP